MSSHIGLSKWPNHLGLLTKILYSFFISARHAKVAFFLVGLWSYHSNIWWRRKLVDLTVQLSLSSYYFLPVRSGCCFPVLIPNWLAHFYARVSNITEHWSRSHRETEANRPLGRPGTKHVR
jgi:hypothetical protein